MSSARLQKMESLREREAAKGDRRARLEAMLVSKLVAKYGRQGVADADISDVVRDFMRHTVKVTESDLAKLENRVKVLARRDSNASDGGMMSARSITSGRGRPMSRSGSTSMPALAMPSDMSEGGGGRTGRTGKAGDEWVMLALFNKMQFEKEKETAEHKAHALKVDTRKFLDTQSSERERTTAAEKKSMLDYHFQQEKELESWKVEEQRKQDQIKAAILVERNIRFAQVDEKKAREQAEKSRKLLDDEADLKRCARAIKEERESAAEAKIRERTYLKEVLRENQSRRSEREAEFKKEADNDVGLMRQYAAKLAAQDKERADAFQGRIRVMAGNEDATYALKAKEREREDVLERSINKYSKAKEDADDARLVREKCKRREDSAVRVTTLGKQLEAKKVIEEREVREEAEYAKLFQKDGEVARQQQGDKEKQLRKRNIEHQKLLVKQMQGATMGEASLYNEGMSNAERLLNKQLVGSITSDPSLLAQLSASQSGKPSRTIDSRKGPRDNSIF